MNEPSLFDLIPNPNPQRGFEPSEPTPRQVAVREHLRTLAPRARRTNPRTSHEAAARVAPTAISTTKYILDAYRGFGPLTPFECAALIPEKREATVRAAVGRLHRAGWLVETGVTRPSPSGSPSAELRLA